MNTTVIKYSTQIPIVLQDNKKYSCLSEFVSILSWVDRQALPVLNVKEEEHNDTGGLKRTLATGAHDLARNIIKVNTMTEDWNNL